MNAAVFLEPNAPLEVRNYPLLEPGSGMASVDLVSTGICGTDVHICEGAIPFTGPMILGHEFLGCVRALGDGGRADCMGAPIAVGDLVAVNVIEPCGACLLCRTGGAASCLRLMESLTYTRSPEEPPHFHGGFAEANVSPTRYLHRLPDGLPVDVASVFLCAGPTVVRAVTYAGGIPQGGDVVVQGSGPVGLFAALYAALGGARTVTVFGSSSHPLRLPLASKLGATAVLDIRRTTADERRTAIMEATGGTGADMVLECSGSPDAVPEGLGLLRPRGIYLLAGQYSDRGSIPVPVHIVTFNALQILGSAQFTSEDRQRYFDCMLGARHVWDAIRTAITHRVPVTDAQMALQAVREGRAVKAVLVPADDL